MKKSPDGDALLEMRARGPAAETVRIFGSRTPQAVQVSTALGQVADIRDGRFSKRIAQDEVDQLGSARRRCRQLAVAFKFFESFAQRELLLAAAANFRLHVGIDHARRDAADT